MKDVAAYLNMPWTIDASLVSDTDPSYWVYEVRELPGFFAAGESTEEASQNFWEALESHLLSYLQAGQEPPVPDSVVGTRELGETIEDFAEHEAHDDAIDGSRVDSSREMRTRLTYTAA